MSIPGIPEAAARSILDVFASDPRVQQVIVYGSRAKGTFRSGSDIDLCLVAPDLDFSSSARLEERLDDLLLPWKIDLSLRHQIDSPDLLEHIDRVGIPLLIQTGG